MDEVKAICNKCGYIHKFDSDIIKDSFKDSRLQGTLIYHNRSENTGWVLLSYDDLKQYEDIQTAVREVISNPEDFLYFVSIYSEGFCMKCLICGGQISVDVEREYTVHFGNKKDIEKMSNIHQLCDSTEYLESYRNVSFYILS